MHACVRACVRACVCVCVQQESNLKAQNQTVLPHLNGDQLMRYLAIVQTTPLNDHAEVSSEDIEVSIMV